jgi:hypothetical protein
MRKSKYIGNKNNSLIEFKKLIFEEVKLRLDRSQNAQRSFTQYFMTINIGYVASLYFLLTSWDTLERKIIYISILSLLIFIVNLFVSLLYIREHYAIDDNMSQIKEIYKSIKTHYKDCVWYKFDDTFKDIFKQFNWFLITSFFTFFTLLPLVVFIILFINLKNKCIFFILFFSAAIIHIFIYKCKNECELPKDIVRLVVLYIVYFVFFCMIFILSNKLIKSY